MDVHFILILILSIIRVFFHLLLCIAYFFCLSVDFWQAEIFPGVLYCTYTQYTIPMTDRKNLTDETTLFYMLAPVNHTAS